MAKPYSPLTKNLLGSKRKVLFPHWLEGACGNTVDPLQSNGCINNGLF
jgi:hypothetical protein